MFAGKSIGQVADHFETIICGLERRPAIIGHSFGGLLTPILAGRGLAVASVAIDPAPFLWDCCPTSAERAGHKPGRATIIGTHAAEEVRAAESRPVTRAAVAQSSSLVRDSAMCGDLIIDIA